MRLKLLIMSMILGFVAGGKVAVGAEVRVLVFTSFRDGNGEIYRVDSKGENLQNLTNHPAEDMHPAWSPDGAKIVFASNRDAQWGLYQMDVNGENLELLLLSDLEIDAPSFSPDGSQISYITYEDRSMRYTNPGTIHVMVASSDGQNPVKLADDIYPVVWSPDGQLLFGRVIWKGMLASINVHDGDTTLMDGFYVGGFSISPDGTQIAYDYGGEFSSITLWDLATGQEKILPGSSPGSELSDFGAQWSPDGTLIAYIGKWSYGIYNIYIIPPDGVTTAHLLVDDETFHTINPIWSPDSTQVAFLAAPGDDEYDFEQDAFDIFVIDVTGDNLVNLSDHPTRDVEPQWQPLMP